MFKTSIVFLLELMRSQVSERGVKSLTVIKDFNVFKYRAGGLLLGIEESGFFQLCFEGTEETLHSCVVVAVAFAAHAWRHMMPAEHAVVFVAGVLNAPV